MEIYYLQALMLMVESVFSKGDSSLLWPFQLSIVVICIGHFYFISSHFIKSDGFYQVRWIVTKFFLKQDYNVFKMKHLKKNISNHFDIRLGTLNNFLYESSYSHWLYQVTHIHFMKCSASGPKTYTGNIKGKIHQRIKSNFFVISLRYFKHQYP